MSLDVLVGRLSDEIEALKKIVGVNVPRINDAPFNAGAAKILTIDGGSIFATRPHILVIPESGVLDDLDFIDNFTDGKFVLISPGREGDTITVRNYLNTPGEAGNIDMYGSGNDRVLTNTHDSVFLYYKEETGHWEQVAPTSLNGLFGVTITEPLTEGEVLQVDSLLNWVNGPVPAGGVPAAHAPTHLEGGSDPLTSTTPVANGVPQADGSGNLANGWLSATLQSIAALGTAADRTIYTTGVNTWAETPMSAYGRTLAALADAAALRAAAELVAGGAGDIWVEKAGDTMSGVLNMGGQLISNLATPLGASDAVTKAYVDAIAEGLDVKASVRAATTVNITLSGAQTIDGVSVIAGDRVLVKNQSTGANNGIYVAAAGAWARSADANVSAEVTSGMFTFVTEGTVNGDTGWALITNDPITLGSTALVFSQFSGPTNIAAAIDNASETTTPAGANKFALVVGGVLTWLSWTNLLATAQTAFNAVYGRLATANSWAGIQTFVTGANVDGAAGTARDFYLKTGGVSRWMLRANATAESGSNVGSDFTLTSFTDAGAGLRNDITIVRSTGAISFAGAIQTPNIADFSSAQHDHLDADDGGVLTAYGLLSAQNIWTAFQTIKVDGSNSQLWLDTYRNSLNQGILLMRSARGTKASPLVSALNDDLGRWVAQGYSAAAGAFVNAAAIYMSVDGTPDSGGDTTDMPSRINIYTSPEGSATLTLAASFDSAQRLNIAGVIRALSAAGIRLEDDAGNLGVFVEDATGDVGIKTAAPTQALQVNSTSTNTAIAISISDVIKGYIFAAGSAAQGSNISEANDLIVRGESNNVIITARNATGDIILATQSPDSQKAILTNAGQWGVGITPTNLISMRAGASTRVAAGFGDIFTDFTQRANSGTTETDLGSFTVPADLLSVNGQALEIYAFGTFVSNVNSKTLKLHWGSNNYILAVGSGSTGTSWSFRATIVRTGAATQNVDFVCIYTSGNITQSVTTATQTLSGTNVLKLTGQSLAPGASNDVLQKYMRIAWRDVNA